MSKNAATVRYVTNLGPDSAGHRPVWLEFIDADTDRQIPMPPLPVVAESGRVSFEIDWSCVPAGVNAIAYVMADPGGTVVWGVIDAPAARRGSRAR